MNRACTYVLASLLMVASAEAQECLSIDILSKAEGDSAVKDDYEGTAIEPDWNQKAVVRESERMMPRLLCLAARRLVFVRQDLAANGGLAGRTDKPRPDLPQMSAAPGPGLASEPELDPAAVPGERPEEAIRRADKVRIARATTVQAILHEAAHSADYLLQYHGSGDYNLMETAMAETDRWTDAAESLAEEITEKNRLEKGFRTEWERIHQRFVRAGWASGYLGRKSEMGSKELVKAGFMSQYGAVKVSDDIAEMTAWAIAGDLMHNAMVDPVYETIPEGPQMHHACVEMQNGSDITEKVAAVFTKVGFLQSVGFISEETYKQCVGELKIGGSGPGFFTLKSGQLDRSYTGAVEKKLYKRGEGKTPWIFELTGSGVVSTTSEPNVPVTVTLRLEVAPHDTDEEDVSYPRGLYTVGLANPDSQLFIARKDNEKVVMEVTDGLALVSRANSDLIEGSVLIFKYFNFSGGLLSAMYGPEPPKEHTKMAFRLGG